MNLKEKGAWCGCSEPQFYCRSGTAAVELNNVHTYEVEHFAEQGSKSHVCIGIERKSITFVQVLATIRKSEVRILYCR
jgi:hypothetical protein